MKKTAITRSRSKAVTTIAIRRTVRALLANKAIIAAPVSGKKTMAESKVYFLRLTPYPEGY